MSALKKPVERDQVIQGPLRKVKEQASPDPVRQARSCQRGRRTGLLSHGGILARQRGEDVKCRDWLCSDLKQFFAMAHSFDRMNFLLTR